MKDETKQILNKWIDFLGTKFWESEGMNKISLQLSQEFGKYTCYPQPENIFKAFNLTQPENLKGIILGQCPYNNPGEATGLSFGVDDRKLARLPPSLIKIYQAIEKEVYNGFLVDFDYTMEKYAKEGILMLNSALTVRHKQPSSHVYIWEDFTKILLAAITCKKEGLHIFLWGSEAQKYQNCIAEGHIIYKAEHPAKSCYENRDWITGDCFKNSSSFINW